MMPRNYFTLVVRFEKGDVWSAQFGDYCRGVVKQEAKDEYGDAHRTRIIKTLDNQASIDMAIAALNSK